MANRRLDRQVEFLLECDKLKHVTRQSLLLNGERQENSAEHSWHLALMAVLLAEHAKEAGVDLLRVIKIALVHDLVEIDAGDTYIYDEEGARDKAAREQAAADRLFALLPPDQGAQLRALWDEYEAGQTAEARFTGALDRLQPLLLNFHTQGAQWRKHGVTVDQVLARNRGMEAGAPTLWAYAERLIRDAVARGYLPQKPTDTQA
ncbi:MAG TPA: HD domain-containing protein [Planctomycetota bacterium]|nr:HD domain-containing protein [Planctomycetota bacterium]